jgi:hypothetical protein
LKFSYFEGNHLNKSTKLNFVVAPYWSQVIDWLIEKHNLSIEILSCFNQETKSTYYEGWVIGDFLEEEMSEEVDIYFTHFQARERTILESLNYLKLKQDENKN